MQPGLGPLVLIDMGRALLLVVCAACATPASSEPRKDRYADHIAALRKRLDAKGLRKVQIRVEEPFVVVGDGTAAALARDAQTVRWAADILEGDFFDQRPAKILDVFLFGTAACISRTGFLGCGIDKTFNGILPSRPRKRPPKMRTFAR